MINRSDISFSKENQVRNNNVNAKEWKDAVADKKWQLLGEGSGIAFSFIQDEEIIFPTLSEAFPFTKKFRDTEILYIAGYSDKRKRFVYIPLSTFRKRPVGEGELDALYDESVRPLNCRLAEASNDLERFRILCETGRIKCDDVVTLNAWVFETDSEGKIHRTDKMKPLKVAYVSAVSETTPESDPNTTA